MLNRPVIRAGTADGPFRTIKDLFACRVCVDDGDDSEDCTRTKRCEQGEMRRYEGPPAQLPRRGRCLEDKVVVGSESSDLSRSRRRHGAPCRIDALVVGGHDGRMIGVEFFLEYGPVGSTSAQGCVVWLSRHEQVEVDVGKRRDNEI